MTSAGAVAAYALCFGFMCWANLVTPLWGDDYCRIVPASAVAPFALAARDYFAWTGRYLVTALTYLVLEDGGGWRLLIFDAVNAGIFLLLIATVLALARLAAGTAARAAGAFDILAVALMLWWLPRDIAEVALWKTGAIGYLWAVAGELWLLRVALEGGRPDRMLPVVAAFFLASFLEPLSVLMSVVLSAWCVRAWRAGAWAPWPMAAAHIAGSLCLLAAPGNFVRADTVPSGTVLQRAAAVAGNLGSLFDPFWLLAAALIAAALSGRPMRMLAAGRGWMFAALAMAYMALLLGVPPALLAARVSFPASVLLICALATLLLLRPTAPLRDRAGAVVLLLLLAAHGSIVVADLERLTRISRDWVAATRAQAAPGAKVILSMQRVGGRLVFARKDRFFEGLTSDPSSFINLCYAHAMGVGAVIAR